MMKRILKRPMFRMGGDVENVGIMDGMRARYKEGPTNQGVQIEDIDSTYKEGDFNVSPTNQSAMPTMDSRFQRRLDLINKLSPGPNLNQFLIDFGLNLASGVPRGNILSTAATAAREPFSRFMEGQQKAQQTKAALALEALDDDDMAEVEKTAEIMANNPKSEFFGKKDEALNAIMSGKIYSKSGKVTPEVRIQQNIDDRRNAILNSRDGKYLSFDAADNISIAIENVMQGRNENVSRDDIDIGNIFIFPEHLGKKDEEAGTIKITERTDTSYTPGTYQEGKKYYNYQDGKFYEFQNDTFIAPQ